MPSQFQTVPRQRGRLSPLQDVLDKEHIVAASPHEGTEDEGRDSALARELSGASTRQAQQMGTRI